MPKRDGGFAALEVIVAKGHERHQNGERGETHFGKRIQHASAVVRVVAAREQARLRHAGQSVGEHIARSARVGGNRVEAALAREELAQDQNRPAIGQ